MTNDDEIIDFLEHFGVKGMQWGVRKEDTSSGRTSLRTSFHERNLRLNTERYNTLRARAAKSDVRISEIKTELATLPKYSKQARLLRQEKSAAIIQRNQDLQKSKKSPTDGLTPTQKKLLIGAGVTAAIIGYSVASKYYDTEGARAAVRRGRSQMKYGDVFKPDPRLAAKMTPDQVLKNVSKQVNPNYGNLGGQMNCRRCTFAYELRRRGYDVQATTSTFGRGQNESGLVNALIKGDRNLLSRQSVSSFASANSPFGVRARGVAGDVRKYTAETDRIGDYRNLRSALSRHPNGARGEALFDMGGFAHSMQWEIFDGVPHIFDSQKGQHFPVTESGLSELTGKWGIPNVTEITRLDNVDLDMEFISRWATNAA